MQDSVVIQKLNPWAAMARAFKDDPDYAEVIEHMKADREQRNRELDALEEVPVETEKPWLVVAGCLKDQPEHAAYQDAIREYRRLVDADPNR